MFRFFPLVIFVIGFVKCNGVSFHYNNTYKYGITYTVALSKSDEYILEFGGDTEIYDTPARVHVVSSSANTTYPIFITARQQKGVLSWQLPMTVQTPGGVEEFTGVSRTLCPHNNLFNYENDSCETTTINTPIIYLSTSSPDSLTISIKVETVSNFYVKLNEDINNYGNMSRLNHTYSFAISPSEPMYFFYSFDQHKNLTVEDLRVRRMEACDKKREERSVGVSGSSDWSATRGVTVKAYDWSNKGGGWFGRPKSVILMIESDNDVCAVVSIQNFSCPVFDNERDILYDGQYLTMTRAGGITLTEEQFPLGFYMVFIVKSSDDDCLDSTFTNDTVGIDLVDAASDSVWTTNGARRKTFRFAVVATISYQDYAIAAGLVLGFFMSFYVAFFVSMCWCRGKIVDMAESAQSEEDLISPAVPHDQSSTSVLVTEYNPSIQGLVRGNENALSNVEPHDSDADSELSVLADIDTDRDMFILPSRLCVASLARVGGRVLRARSNLYTWSVLTVAVFYTLPVVQLVFTYQRLLNQSGNQDLCYYNFLCSHPLGMLSDFNHVYSNIGYVLLGALFLLQVYRRHLTDNRTREEKELGIPQHYGLLYAMGIALVSEGLLSGSYHVCPNNMNFQFDTSFMYVTAVLCMVKIYQSRHPDINARAHATFGVLALIIFIGLVGVLNSSVYIWALFTIIHISACFILTFKIYYMGRFKFDGNILCRAARELVSTPIAAVTPIYCGRMVLLILVNLANWALAAYGMYYHNKDFSSHLLVVMMGNLFLYTNFYVIMKLLHRERITKCAWLFFALTHATWYTAAYFFLQQSTNWALTPAQSRQYNTVCYLLHLYDSHDIWHLLSAVAMFFSFNMYMTIDDNLYQTPRTQIMVF